MSEQERLIFELLNSFGKPVNQDAAYDALEYRLIMNAICQHCGQRNGEHSYWGELCPVTGSRNHFQILLEEE